METKVNYPENCDQITKLFVDKVNNVLEHMGGIVLGSYYLGQNGVYNTIYKICLPNYIVATIECFNDEGTGLFNNKKHYELIKFVKYNENMSPVKTYKLPFRGITSVEIGINVVNQ